MCIRLDLVKVPCKTGNIKSHFLHQRNQDLPKTVCHDKLELRMISGEMSWMPILWRNASCWLHRQCLRCVSLTKCGNCRVFHHNLMTPLLHFFLLIFLCLFFFYICFYPYKLRGGGFMQITFLGAVCRNCHTLILYTGLFKMIVRVLTTCHTQYT